MAPRLHLVELGLYDSIRRAVMSELDRAVAEAWEEESLRHFLHLLASLGEEVLEAGPWWHRGVEIDAVIVTKNRVYGLEAKWSRLGGKDLARIAARLEARLEQLPWARHGYETAPVAYARELEARPYSGEAYSLDDRGGGVENPYPQPILGITLVTELLLGLLWRARLWLPE